MLPKKNGNSEVAAHHQRNEILDFVKGLLLYSMVVYHTAFNFYEHYEVVLGITKYVSGAFIYITGFLVGHYYFEKHAHDTSYIRRRLFLRGLKIFFLFLALNITFLIDAARTGGGAALHGVFMKYIFFGTGEARFEILLPISYILLFSSLTASFFRTVQAENNKTAMLNVCLVVILLISDTGLLSPSTNYYFFIIGLFGLSNSLIVKKIRNTDAMQLITAFLVMAFAWLRFHFTFGSILFIYTLYIICVLATFYNIGRRINLNYGVAQWTVRIGRHTLFSYIYHVLLIVGLSRLYPVKVAFFGNVFIMVVVSGIVISSVILLERLQKSSKFIDRSYSLIFR